MLVKLLNDIEMGGCWFRSGTIFGLAPSDIEQDDGSLKFHFMIGRFVLIPKGQYKILYSSIEEMERKLKKETG